MKRHRTNKSFQPRFEPLEDRCCPTTLVRVEGNYLYIIGDETVNQAEISISGRETSVAVDGGPAQPIEFSICCIVIDMAGADDRASIAVQGRDVLLQSVTADLGAGDDCLTAHITGETSHAVAIDADLGGGSDSASVEWTDLAAALDVNVTIEGGLPDIHVGVTTSDIGTVGAASGQLQAHDDGAANDQVTAAFGASEAAIDFDVSLGRGNDTLFVDVTGSQSGPVIVNADLGDGNDRFQFENDGQIPRLPPPPAPPPLFLVNALGGLGNDTITVLDKSLRPGLNLDIRAELGGGNDSFEATFRPTESLIPGPDDGPAHVQLEVRGQDGNDTVSIFQPEWGSVPGPTDFVGRVDLGGGDDSLQATFKAGNRRSAPRSRGPISALTNSHGDFEKIFCLPK
jgi:hypothetical protein